MKASRVLSQLVSALLLCSVNGCGAKAQSPTERKALAGTVSIGDTVRQLDASAVKTKVTTVPVSTNGTPQTTILTNAKPIHILYVHGINQTGPDDSKLLRKGICHVFKECNDRVEGRTYAEGPFKVGAPRPDLRYLGQPVWATDDDWNASTPFLVRHRISGNGKPPFVIDEVNWYPLAYSLKCQFLVPVDRSLTGRTKANDRTCDATTVKDGERFLTYQWKANAELLKVDMPKQKATEVNGNLLKSEVMDWGFGDAAMALGPMQEIICAAIRQLLVQSLHGVAIDETGKPLSGIQDKDVPVFFVTHSLGSYLSLAAMDTDWDDGRPGMLDAFSPTGEQIAATDYFRENTRGFYFLANQISLLELARLSAPGYEATHVGTVPPSVALENLVADNAAGTQIVAWSAADDLLSWYVPNLVGAKVVNFPAHNHAFHIPGLLANPVAVHSNYADNKKVLRVMFGTTSP